MNIAIVDDEKYAIIALEEVIKNIRADSVIHGFRFAADFLAHLTQHRVDIAFLDIEMADMNGLALAKRVKEAQPAANIIFVSGYSQYALEAHSLYVTGFLLKPPTEEKVQEALSHLRNPIDQSLKTIRVQCFGNFEVFFKHAPLKFKYSKTKELLAYLIDRKGASATTDELCTALFEEQAGRKSIRSYFRNLMTDLAHTLRDVNAESVLIKSRNHFAVDITQVDCDYYRSLQTGISSTHCYGGEYMSQYSWAEITLGGREYRKNK